jgi:hypothetical protein
MATYNMSDFVPDSDPTAIACPCCGRVDWKYLDEQVFLLIARRGEEGTAVVGSEAPGIVTAAFLCRACRFIRLQALDM